MPSHQHQTLVMWGVRRMLCDGFRITGIDGFVERLGYPVGFPRPPTLAGVRPDASGLREDLDIDGFVEAKSEHDIDNAHTRKQLRELANVRSSSGRQSMIYVVIPRGAAYALDRVLIDLGLLGAAHIRRLHVPGTLLEH